MKIRFRELGGFAPVARECELDPKDLSPEEGWRLKALFEASGILDLNTGRVREARDIRMYEFIVESDGGSRRLVLDQLTLPDTARPLLAALHERAYDLADDY